VVLKLKTSEFDILTRSHTPRSPPSSWEELAAIALLLREKINEMRSLALVRHSKDFFKLIHHYELGRRSLLNRTRREPTRVRPSNFCVVIGKTICEIIVARPLFVVFITLTL
jgi:hypothetical protein